MNTMRLIPALFLRLVSALESSCRRLAFVLLLLAAAAPAFSQANDDGSLTIDDDSQDDSYSTNGFTADVMNATGTINPIGSDLAPGSFSSTTLYAADMGLDLDGYTGSITSCILTMTITNKATAQPTNILAVHVATLPAEQILPRRDYTLPYVPIQPAPEIYQALTTGPQVATVPLPMILGYQTSVDVTAAAIAAGANDPNRHGFCLGGVDTTVAGPWIDNFSLHRQFIVKGLQPLVPFDLDRVDPAQATGQPQTLHLTAYIGRPSGRVPYANQWITYQLSGLISTYGASFADANGHFTIVLNSPTSGTVNVYPYIVSMPRANQPEVHDLGRTFTVQYPSPPGTVAATEDSGPRGCPDCDGQLVATTSLVQSGLQAHIHDAVDYAIAAPSGGCASCGGVAPSSTGALPSLEIHRYHRYLDQAWLGSFGPGVFLGYDHRLVVHAAARVVEWWTPQRPVVTLLKDPSQSGSFTDDRFHDLAGCTFADASGARVVDPLTATRATLAMFDGSTETYELVAGPDASGDTRFGRLLALADRNGQGIALAYVLSAATASPDTCFEIATITDAHGLVARPGYVISDGHPAIRTIDLPNGTRLTYGYGGQPGTLVGLRSVAYPDGAASTFDTVWSTADQLQTVRYFDAGAVGIHRRKQVGFSPVDMTWANGAVATEANRVRQVVNGDGELVYKCWLETGGPVGNVPATTLIYFFDGGDPAHGMAMRRLTTDNGIILSSERATTWSWATNESTWQWQKVEDDTLDATQRLTSRVVPGVGTTSFQLDPVTGSITKQTFPDGTSETTTYNAFNEPLRQVDRLGRVTTYTYDDVGNLTAKTVADGTPEASTTRWAYGEAGANARPGQPTSRTDPLGNVTRFAYDAHGFLAATIAPKDAPGDDANPTRRFTYDADGSLAASTDESGRQVRYAYDARGRLTTVTYGDGSSEGTVYGTGSTDANLPVLMHDRNGDYTVIRYDGSGRELARFVGLLPADGATPSTSLSSYGNLESASVTTTSYVAGTDLVAESVVDGQAMDFVYDNFRREISRSWTDLNGEPIADLTAWDSSGRVDSRTHSVNTSFTWSTSYVYDSLDRVVRTIREATSQSASSLKTPAQRLAAVRAAVPSYLIEDRAYDLSAAAIGYSPASPVQDRVNEVRTTTDARGIVHLDAFDHQGRLVEHIDAFGTADVARTAYEYDAVGNRTRMYHPRHFTEAGGFTTAFAYTGRNLRSLVREAEGRPEQSDTVTTYSPTGNVASVTEAAGTADAATTVYRYGACCDRLREKQDPEGYLTEYLYDPNGNPIGIIDPLQHVTVMEYDSRNRVTRRTDGEANATRFVYDDDVFDGRGLDAAFTSLSQGLTVATAAGNPVNAPRAVATIDAAGGTSYVVVDHLGRPWSRFDALGNHTSIRQDDGASGSTTTTDPLGDATSTQVDGAGRVISTSDGESRKTTFTYDGNGNRLSTTDPNGNGPSATYDQRDRVATVSDSVGSTTTNTYDAQGNVIATRDALGKTTTFAYDGRNRKISATDRLGGVTRFAYDGRNNLVALQDAEQRVTTYRYDRRNLLLAETFPGATGGTRTYAYDGAGRLQRRVDQTGTATTYEYDRANRLTARRYPDGLDDLLGYDAVGRLSHAASGRYGNAVDRVYDVAGRLVTETQTIGGVPYLVRRSYDTANRVTHIAYPGGDAVDRTYTARNQLNQVSFDGTPVAVRTYDAGMRPSTTQYFPLGNTGGAANETRTYNADDTVKSIIALGVTSLTYAYNADKSVTSETDGLLAASSQTFAYDDEQRLTAWSRGNGDAQSWRLTAVGDWQDTTVNGALETRTHSDVHEVTSITRGTATTPLGYDMKGNLTLDQNGARYGWDLENRLQTATIADEIENVGDVATYAYDALGRRVQKTAWGVTTTFLHDGDQVIREFDAPQQLQPSAANDDGDGSGTPPGGGILPNALVRVNFQPALRAIPPGFVADKGKVLASRTNGYSYGWDVDRSADTIARGVHPLPQYDTFIRMVSNTAAPGAWSIALPNGTYPVIVVMGDAISRHQTNNVVIQGIAETDPDPYDPNETQGYLLGDFDGYAELVTVWNGTLTIQVGNGAIDPKLCFIEIGHNGDPLDQATRDKLAAQVGSATQRTGGTPFPKPQPSPREYLYSTGIDHLLAYVAGGHQYAVEYDRNRSVTTLVDTSGNVVERYAYDAFGKRTVLSATGVALGTDSTVGQTRGFTGYILDHDTGLYHARARQYDPTLGRFIGRDPLGYVDGSSLYSAYFVPNGTDPTGTILRRATQRTWVPRPGGGGTWANAGDIYDDETGDVFPAQSDAPGSAAEERGSNDREIAANKNAHNDASYAKNMEDWQYAKDHPKYVDTETGQTYDTFDQMYAAARSRHNGQLLTMGVAVGGYLAMIVQPDAGLLKGACEDAIKKAFGDAADAAAKAAADAAEKAAADAAAADEGVTEGTKVYRVWGDKAGPNGRSWTTVDPRTVPNYRDAAGLPEANSGRFVSEGVITDTTGVQSRGALPLDGNEGGLPEVVIPDPANQVQLQGVSGVNPQY